MEGGSKLFKGEMVQTNQQDRGCGEEECFDTAGRMFKDQKKLIQIDLIKVEEQMIHLVPSLPRGYKREGV